MKKEHKVNVFEALVSPKQVKSQVDPSVYNSSGSVMK